MGRLPRLMTVGSAAALMGLSRRQFQRAAEELHLHSAALGVRGTLFYRRDDILRAKEHR